MCVFVKYVDSPLFKHDDGADELFSSGVGAKSRPKERPQSRVRFTGRDAVIQADGVAAEEKSDGQDYAATTGKFQSQSISVTSVQGQTSEDSRHRNSRPRSRVRFAKETKVDSVTENKPEFRWVGEFVRVCRLCVFCLPQEPKKYLKLTPA